MNAKFPEAGESLLLASSVHGSVVLLRNDGNCIGNSFSSAHLLFTTRNQLLFRRLGRMLYCTNNAVCYWRSLLQKTYIEPTLYA